MGFKLFVNDEKHPVMIFLTLPNLLILFDELQRLPGTHVLFAGEIYNGFNVLVNVNKSLRKINIVPDVRVREASMCASFPV